MKPEYDLIVSLGANCSVAHNLRFRGLRPVSLPFDWCYFVDDAPIHFWIDEVGRGFSGLLKRENLVEILPDAAGYSPQHPDVRQYIDTKSGYRFVNHFHRTIDEPGEYEAVYVTIRRRADRLVSAFEGGGSFLLLLATQVDVSRNLLQRLVATLSERFGNSRFDLRYLHFGQECDSELDLGGGFVVQDIGRRANDYDFYKTNYEWHFLDDIRLSGRFIRNRKPRKFSFHIVPKVKCVVTFTRTGVKYE